MSVAWPSIGIDTMVLTLNENKGGSQSLFTRARQFVDLAGGTGDRWEGVIRTRILSKAEVKTLFNFLVEIGLYGQFTIADPDYDGPAAAVTTASVVGAGQTGKTLDVDGLTPSTLLLQKGERFQVGSEYKMLTADATTDGSGAVTLNFKPAIRTSPADNATVTLDSPVLLCRLLADPSRETDSLKMGVFSIPFEEV